VLINVDPKQSDQLTTYLQKMPEIYSCYNTGIQGNIGAVTTLKTLEQLNEIKDEIKNRFSVLEMKTAIWTDVKEMNENLAIIDGKKVTMNFHAKAQKNNHENITIDQIDQKIADKLAENGRIPMETLAKEIGISPEKAKKRYEKLKKNGALKITIQINPYKIGYRALCIFFTVTSNEESFLSIDKISQIPDVISIMKTSGNYDLQIYAMVKNLEQLLSIQEEIGKTPGIRKFDLQMSGLEYWEKWPSPRQYISTF
jgi:Lrp/AsnC family transcriptional regulator for asnA, asnC and gidA